MTDEKFDYSDYLSPFTWRYGSKEMRDIYSEINFRTIWRKIWVALAEAQADYGLVSEEELEDLKSNSSAESIDLERAHEIEKEIRHDIMAEVKTFAEQCSKGGGKIHLGATSMDIRDNADALRMKQALNIILNKLVDCLEIYSNKIEENKDLACMGWTHLQPAEPTTLGYRFSNYAQDLVMDVKSIEIILDQFLKGKGIKGAVGTSASYSRLLRDKGEPAEMEKKVMENLGIEAYPVSTQTYPRKLDFMVLNSLASIAQSVHKFALDLRHLQSPPFGELSEPMKESQVGSSAMPQKKNPITTERMCSLARYVSELPAIAWENASQSVFERTLDDSANRRLIIPEAFLAVDECLDLYRKTIQDIGIYPKTIERNMEKYGPFAGTEVLLMKLAEKGKDRQKMHERLRKISSKAWQKVNEGEKNPLPKLLKKDEIIVSEFDESEIEKSLNPNTHIGDAPSRCEKFLRKEVEPILSRYEDKEPKEKDFEF
ncbi:MAG: adenylosuccinate lyase [Candidatus Hadarchaeia archaeon]